MTSTWRCKKKIFLGTTSSKSLRSLANRYYTIITKADKRSLVVVIDICDYINETNIELNNTSFYNKTDTDPTKVNWLKDNKTLAELKTVCLLYKKKMSLREKWPNTEYFSGPHFPTFGLNTEGYSVSLRIQSEWGKMRTRKNSCLDTFHVVCDNQKI